MKKNLKTLTVAIATGMFMIGLTTSLSSFSTASTVSTEDTGTGDTGGSESMLNAVFVAGEDCSVKEPMWDFETGKILGYWIYKQEQSLCRPGSVICFKQWQVPCHIISVDFEPSTNQ